MKKLNLSGIVGHCTVTGGSVQAWYRLGTFGWEYRPDAERETRIITTADGYSQLVGRTLHLRVTTRPWSVREWARAHDRDAQEPLPGWSDHLVALQGQLGGQSLAAKESYLGVSIPSSTVANLRELYAAPARAVGLMPLRQSRETVRALLPAITGTDEVMARTGFAARPVTPRELEWLMHRSVGLGLPAPSTLGAVSDAEWEAGDLHEFTDAVEWEPVPFTRTMAVSGERDAETVRREVAVLSIGRMADMEIPGASEPWLQKLDRLPFPVEVSARIKIESDEAVRQSMRKTLQKIRAQRHHYEDEHQEPAPPQLGRQSNKALAIEDELTAGLAGLATRSRSWVRIAVSAKDARTARQRADKVRDLYSPGISVSRPIDLHAVAREFIPGEPMGSTAHTRRMPVTTLAAAMPNATAQWGDHHGIPLGETAGTSVRAAVLQLWDATEHNESGLCACCGGLGSGKTNLLGWIVYCACMSGIPFEVLDPSGRLQALADLPELAGRCRVVDLLDGDPGVLGPFRVIADPSAEHYPDPKEYAKRVRDAQDARRQLAQATLEQLLSQQMGAHPLTEVALLDAVAAVKPITTSSLISVVEALERLDGDDDPELAAHGRRLAKFYRRVADTGPGRLLFAAGYMNDYRKNGAGEATPILTVYSLRGLSIPDDDDNTSSRGLRLEQRMALCLLSNAAWLTTRRMYFGPRDQRKGVAIDEARVLRRVSTGRTLMDAVSADSRKHNTVALIADQTASKLVELGLPNLCSMAFMGRLTDPREQRAALEFLPGVEAGHGYESILGNLSAAAKRAGEPDELPTDLDGDHATAAGPEQPVTDALNTGGEAPAPIGRTNESREFIARDWRGQVEKIAIVLNSHPHVQAALNTTPGKPKRRQGASAPRRDVMAEVVDVAKAIELPVELTAELVAAELAGELAGEVPTQGHGGDRVGADTQAAR